MLGLLTAGAGAQLLSDKFPDPASGYAWRKEAARAGLAKADIEALAAQKILMGRETYRQVFTPYIETDLPVFVTSDSLLGAFHVLFEESVLRMEEANARLLPEVLKFVWEGLQTAGADLTDRPELAAPARRRARIVIGTALALVGEKPAGLDAETAAIIAAEGRKVENARLQMEKPAWLGPAERDFLGLDYTRYRPRGFYVRSEALARHFRAVAWLQSIPFRVAKDEELLAILMLGDTLGFIRFRGAPQRHVVYHRFFRAYRYLLGAGDDWDLVTAAFALHGQLPRGVARSDLARRRQSLLEEARKRGDWPLINDQLRFPPDAAPEDVPAAEPNFRILSACRTPDAALFQRTTDLRGPARPFPDGLQVVAALGSAWARARLPGADDALLKTIDETAPLFKGEGLYARYLHCVAALLDPPETGAPAFMAGDAWQAKSAQAALAGWAQLRHTWALQAKQSVTYACAVSIPPGFVEPEPEFFARMATLLTLTRQAFDDLGVLAPDRGALAAEVRGLARQMREKKVAEKGGDAPMELVERDPGLFERLFMLLACIKEPGDDRDRKKALAEAPARLDALADRIARHGIPGDERFQRFLRETHADLAPLWERLQDVCRRLEGLARKELRGEALTPDEGRFIMGYGVRIAGCMLYGGNSYVHPRDDAPRAIDVHANPYVSDKRCYLEAAVARPRALYVLYPYGGGEVLCRGAVVPYYEFRSAERLTDAEWRALLDAGGCPAPPDWVQPLLGSALSGGEGGPARAPHADSAGH
jgi:hypothetical protein